MGTLSAPDATACASKSFEIEQLARRLDSCTHRTEAALARLGNLQLREWQSPAGRAYRTTLAVQHSALRRGRDALLEASVKARRHAQAAATPSGRSGS